MPETTDIAPMRQSPGQGEVVVKAPMYIFILKILAAVWAVDSVAVKTKAKAFFWQKKEERRKKKNIQISTDTTNQSCKKYRGVKKMAERARVLE
jgi:hypothetical protein